MEDNTPTVPLEKDEVIMFHSWEEKNRNHYMQKIKYVYVKLYKNEIKNNVILIIITLKIL